MSLQQRFVVLSGLVNRLNGYRLLCVFKHQSNEGTSTLARTQRDAFTKHLILNKEKTVLSLDNDI